MKLMSIAVFVLSAIPFALSADPEAAYSQMAPLGQYLAPNRSAEVDLARSAAPDSIARDAKVLVLGEHGYETAVEGKNGFVCLVERGWMAPFDNPEFWNPRMRGPVCYNPTAARAVVPYTLKRTALVLAGRSKAQIREGVVAAVARKELSPPEAGAMSYMLSKDGYLGDSSGHWKPHLMFHAPKTESASWGANLPGSPILLDDRDIPEPETIFLVPVSFWSDGTPAGPHDHQAAQVKPQ